jgi:hypothetical protein
VVNIGPVEFDQSASHVVEDYHNALKSRQDPHHFGHRNYLILHSGALVVGGAYAFGVLDGLVSAHLSQNLFDFVRTVLPFYLSVFGQVDFVAHHTKHHRIVDVSLQFQDPVLHAFKTLD